MGFLVARSLCVLFLIADDSRAGRSSPRLSTAHSALARVLDPVQRPFGAPMYVSSNELACPAATLPCVQSLLSGHIESVQQAPSKTAANLILEDQCENCNSPVEEFNQYIEECNIPDEDSQEFLIIADIMLAACNHTECASEALWAAFDIAERADVFCPATRTDCARAVLEPYLDLTFSAGGRPTSACYYEVYLYSCIQDSVSGTLCTALLDGDRIATGNVSADIDDDTSSVKPFCDSNCVVDMHDIVERFKGLECGFGADPISVQLNCADTTRLSDFSVLDICTKNDEGLLCADIMTSEAMNFESCDFGAATAETSVCTEECHQELELATAEHGCCMEFMMDLSCYEPHVRAFMDSSCEVTFDQCVRPDGISSQPFTTSCPSSFTFAVSFLLLFVCF